MSDTSMTIPDFHASARDATSRPEAPSSPGLGKDGWAPEGLLYDAFISYSWGNLDVADKIERNLERFPLPPAIRRRLGRRRLNVFRDESDLTGNVLDAALEHKLEQSRTLVVLCSPAARRSEPVRKEIKRFAELRHAGQIVPVLVAGGPNNDARVGPAEWAFPDALSDVLGGNPFATDLRRDWSIEKKAELARSSPWVQLVAGIVGATTDDIRDRIRQQQRKWRIRFTALGVAVVLLISAAYLCWADSGGLTVLGGAAVRDFVDRHDLSFFRPARSDAEIRQAASSFRRELLTALKTAQTGQGGIVRSLKPGDPPVLEYWANGQALAAMLTTPEFSEAEAGQFRKAVEIPFAPGAAIEGTDGRKYGWPAHNEEDRPQAEPAMWTAVALANALGRPGFLTGDARDDALENLSYTHEVLKIYRPNDNGGWSMFPNKADPSNNNIYTTTVALLALLETRRASLPWDGSVEKRDRLLQATAQWLADEYDDKAPQPGWRSSSEFGEKTETYEGLTLQIYGELLRAEAEAGFVLPARILTHMTDYLIHMVDYLAQMGDLPVNLPRGFGEFETESVEFLWYPWAIYAAQLWLVRAEKHGEPTVNRLRVRRALGDLIVKYGSEVVHMYKSDATFKAAETLYGLSAIPNR